VSLLSNNPDKAAQLGRLGVTVVARVPTGVHLSEANAAYLSTKARNGHSGLAPMHLSGAVSPVRTDVG
jgi:GTP cyclohydrolase II